MQLSVGRLVSGAVWTIGGFGLGQAVRFTTNIAIARLLSPDLFGVMLIVNTIRTGTELVSDVGINQNIVYSSNALKPTFYNTAWTLRIIRSFGLWLVLFLAAIPAAHFYKVATLAIIIPVSAISVLFIGCSSLSPAISQKQMKFITVSIFNIGTSAVSGLVLVSLCYFSRTIWALVFAGIAGSAVEMVGSYIVPPHLRYRFHIDRRSATEIASFGRWIFLGSIVYFLSMNFDRLYLAKLVPLELLGIYGIARSMSDLMSNAVLHLGSSVVFPFIASHKNLSRQSLRLQLASTRVRSFFLMAVGCSLLISTADLVVKILYDQRYQSASWMLPVLFIGSWFSSLAAINEATLLGLGMPPYSAIANGVKFALLVILIPAGVKFYGLAGGIFALAIVELLRYLSVLIAQKRELFSFGGQDFKLTAMMVLMTIVLETIRWAGGVGTSFDSLLEIMGPRL
jgi:O-antigen/teichoic acid export membrane protein